MASFDVPSINADKSNEENIQATKGYLYSLAESLTYYINNLESRVSALEEMINNSKE